MTTLPFDPTGESATNLILNEVHTLTKQNYRDYHYIVPKFAPFYAESVKLKIVQLDMSEKELVLGIDYHLTHKFITASTSIAKGDICGSITFLDNELSGVLYIEKYQALGGIWTATDEELLKIVSSAQKNPRITSWESVSGRPVHFPVVNHEYDLINLKGTNELIEAIDRLSLSVIEYIQNSEGYTNEEINRLLNLKLDKNGTAFNTNKFDNKTMSEHISEINQLIDAKILNYSNAQPKDYATLQQVVHIARRVSRMSIF